MSMDRAGHRRGEPIGPVVQGPAPRAHCRALTPSRASLASHAPAPCRAACAGGRGRSPPRGRRARAHRPAVRDVLCGPSSKSLPSRRAHRRHRHCAGLVEDQCRDKRDGTGRSSGPPTSSGTAAQEWFVVCDSFVPGPVRINPAEERRRGECSVTRGSRPRCLVHQAHSPSLTPVAPRPGDHCPRGRPRARAPRSRRRSPRRSRRSWPHADRS